MNIGIVVFSRTGHTLEVAEKLRAAFTSKGQTATVARVEAEEKSPGRPAKLISAPDLSIYDIVVFGSPVEAFSLSKPMKAYMENLPSLDKKKVFCYVTKNLLKKWTGGTRAIKQMTAICLKKFAPVSKAGIVQWASNTRDTQIENIVSDFSDLG